MAIFKGGKGRDDTFTGGTKADRFEFDPLDLNGGDTIVGGSGRAIDVLRFTAPGAIGVSALAHVSGIERIELADGGASSLVLSDEFAASANGGRVQVAGGNGDNLIYASGLMAGHAIDYTAGAGTDYVFAGAGSDTFAFDLEALGAEDRVIGGMGDDVVRLTGTGDLTAGDLAGFALVDAFDLGDGGVRIDVQDALIDASDAHRLTIRGGDSADRIEAATVTGEEFGNGNRLDLYGGGGNDVIVVGAADTVTIDGGEGTDEIHAGRASIVYDANDTIVTADQGTLVVRGSATIDLTRGDDQSIGDAAVITGFANVSAVDAKVGVTLIGELFANLAGGSGQDTITGGSTITGGRGADMLTGNTIGTNFVLNAGDFARGETISGLGYSDTLTIHGTNDLRSGQVSGINVLSLGGYYDQQTADLTVYASQISEVSSITGYKAHLQVVMDKAGVVLPDLHSSVYGVTIDVQGSDGADRISGSYNEVHGGRGNDVILGSGPLYGDGGNDVITVDLRSTSLVDGGEGTDTLVLTSGYDPFDMSREVTIDLGAVRDQVSSHALQATGFENVDLSGLFALSNPPLQVTVRGDERDNTLVGSNGTDILIGGAGDDMITGLYGQDTITTGTGADRIVWTDHYNNYTITDFNSRDDTLVFDRVDANGNVQFDYNGAKFDTLVRTNGGAADLRGADLLVLTGDKAYTASQIAEYLQTNGTGKAGEGLFVLAEDSVHNAILYYVGDSSGYNAYYTTSMVANLGQVPLNQITVADFSFI